MADETQTITAPEVTVTPKAQPRPAPDMPDFSKDEKYQQYFNNVRQAAEDYRTKLGAQEKLESGLPETRKKLLGPAIEKLGLAAEAERPKPSTLEKQPEVPSLKPRPFGTITPGSDVAQAFQQLVGGLSSVVLAFAGMKAPVAALNALSGAMEGWAEGDLIRAQRQWKEYEGKVAKIQRDNEVALTEYDLARTQRADDREAAQLLFQARMAEFGLNEYAAQVGERGMERSAQLWQMTSQQLQQYQKMAEQTIGHRLQYLRLLETIQAHGDTAAYREDVLKGQKEGREETVRYHQSEAERKEADEAARELDRNLSRGLQRDTLNLQEKRLGLAEEKEKRASKYQNAILELRKDIQKDKERARDEKAAFKVEQDIIGIEAKSETLDALERAVKITDQYGLLPRARDLKDDYMARAKLQGLALKRPDLARQLSAEYEIVVRMGVPLIIGKEMQLQGGVVGPARLKVVAEAEAGNLDKVNKEFWDWFIGTLRPLYKKNLASLKKRQSQLEKGGVMPNPAISVPDDDELEQRLQQIEESMQTLGDTP